VHEPPAATQLAEGRLIPPRTTEPYIHMLNDFSSMSSPVSILGVDYFVSDVESALSLGTDNGKPASLALGNHLPNNNTRNV
jgi:hypothetical protein